MFTLAFVCIADSVASRVSRFDIFIQLEFWRRDQYTTCSINYVQLYSQYLHEVRTEQIALLLQNTCLHGTSSVRLCVLRTAITHCDIVLKCNLQVLGHQISWVSD